MITRFKNTAQLVRRRRVALSLTQKELAQKIGVHIQAISNIERGFSGIPATRAKMFSKALGIPLTMIAQNSADDFYFYFLRKAK